uniref:Uncharacterized protein n=1 Tax=Rhizophora mucronata TaxID=61149 RepID=A0A2P2K2H0_RHIMU
MMENMSPNLKLCSCCIEESQLSKIKVVLLEFLSIAKIVQLFLEKQQSNLQHAIPYETNGAWRGINFRPREGKFFKWFSSCLETTKKTNIS